MSEYAFDYTRHFEEILPLLQALELAVPKNDKDWARFIKKFPKNDGRLFSKNEVITAYRLLAGSHGLAPLSESLIATIKMKPVRTLSGVTPVTVLTKPFPCPGKCIFCPNDIRMPKSYLSDEPGAQRAERNFFDPYLQTYNRLQALHNIGHSVEKVELIILGGTWSFYPEAYQIWFIKECFRALNDFGVIDGREKVSAHYQAMEQKLLKNTTAVLSSNPEINQSRLQKHEIQGEVLDQTYNQVVSHLYVAPERLGGFHLYQQASWPELEVEQQKNETAHSRSVGLVIETRPDNISEAEVIRIRRLGCTKAQIGFQSLQDEVLTKNKRGHTVAASRRAVALLRQAGFKIHGHWMANLYGSSVKADKKDFEQLFNDPDFKPDELKVYPCSLIGSAELMQYYNQGFWQPYTFDELLEVVTHVLRIAPAYSRLTRVVRDIPSTDIVEGNKLTNFRQIADEALKKSGIKARDIRAREIKNLQIDEQALQLTELYYETSVSTEAFLQFVVSEKGVAAEDQKVAGFLRLSLPSQPGFIEELNQAAIIREIHVYGEATGISQKSKINAQHGGLGTRLIKRAIEIARVKSCQKLAVISAVGTREYYRKKGFSDGELYQHLEL